MLALNVGGKGLDGGLATAQMATAATAARGCLAAEALSDKGQALLAVGTVYSGCYHKVDEGMATATGQCVSRKSSALGCAEQVFSIIYIGMLAEDRPKIGCVSA